jgi:MFS family permease
MSVPPYVVACALCIAGGFLADRARQRGIFMIGYCGCALIGLIILASSDKASTRYVGCFFFASGVFPNVPQGVAWNGNNIGGTTKRAVGIAMHVGAGSLGGVIASFIYLSKDSPRFIPGHCILIGFVSQSALLSIFMTIYLRRENARRDREYKSPLAYTMEELVAERLKGDYATFFRYTV